MTYGNVTEALREEHNKRFTIGMRQVMPRKESFPTRLIFRPLSSWWVKLDSSSTRRRRSDDGYAFGFAHITSSSTLAWFGNGRNALPVHSITSGTDAVSDDYLCLDWSMSRSLSLGTEDASQQSRDMLTTVAIAKGDYQARTELRKHWRKQTGHATP
jgi:hypothetical protein